MVPECYEVKGFDGAERMTAVSILTPANHKMTRVRLPYDRVRAALEELEGAIVERRMNSPNPLKPRQFTLCAASAPVSQKGQKISRRAK